MLVMVAAAVPQATAGTEAEPRPELSLPIACEVGRDCFVQNYVDIDPGTAARDFACGDATYDAHSGTDIRLLSAAAAKAGVAVLAAADGVVQGARDGVPDIFFSEGGRSAIRGRECGNGVVLDHGNGWVTQYCHMRRGSVQVTKGRSVKRGERLGEVGYSGMADFAHVHLAVRHHGKPVDPFTTQVADGACRKDGESGRGLWTEDAAAALAYRTDEILGAEIAGSFASAADFEHDDKRLAPATADSGQLLLVVRLIKLRAGDIVRLVLTGPGGLRIEGGEKPLARAKATYVAYAGSKRPAGIERWPGGSYEGLITIERDGKILKEMRVAKNL